MSMTPGIVRATTFQEAFRLFECDQMPLKHNISMYEALEVSPGIWKFSYRFE